MEDLILRFINGELLLFLWLRQGAAGGGIGSGKDRVIALVLLKHEDLWKSNTPN